MDAAEISAERPVAAHHAMAWDDDRQRVGGAGGADGPHGAGAPGAEQPAGGAEAGTTEKKDNVVDADYEIVDDDKKK